MNAQRLSRLLQAVRYSGRLQSVDSHTLALALLNLMQHPVDVSTDDQAAEILVQTIASLAIVDSSKR